MADQKGSMRKSHRVTLERMNDEELMRHLQSGVEEAFNILVDRYRERLASYLYHFLHDQKQTEDLLQETFLRVFRNRHAYEPIAKFSTWLYTIAGNLARSEYRRRKRHRTYSIYGEHDDEEYELPIPSDALSPDRFAERGFHSRRIDEALEQLGESFREVVVLRDIQHLSYEEIAEITALPMGTVKSRINRGRTKMQEMLKDVYVPEED